MTNRPATSASTRTSRSEEHTELQSPYEHGATPCAPVTQQHHPAAPRPRPPTPAKNGGGQPRSAGNRARKDAGLERAQETRGDDEHPANERQPTHEQMGRAHRAPITV